jgi:hypothetical protein
MLLTLGREQMTCVANVLLTLGSEQMTALKQYCSKLESANDDFHLKVVPPRLPPSLLPSRARAHCLPLPLPLSLVCARHTICLNTLDCALLNGVQSSLSTHTSYELAI